MTTALHKRACLKALPCTQVPASRYYTKEHAPRHYTKECPPQGTAQPTIINATATQRPLMHGWTRRAASLTVVRLVHEGGAKYLWYGASVSSCGHKLREVFPQQPRPFPPFLAPCGRYSALLLWSCNRVFMMLCYSYSYYILLLARGL